MLRISICVIRNFLFYYYNYSCCCNYDDYLITTIVKLLDLW